MRTLCIADGREIRRPQSGDCDRLVSTLEYDPTRYTHDFLINSFHIRNQDAMAETTKSTDQSANKSAPLAHIVFFTLAESNDANRTRLIEGCKKYLDKHDGLDYFGVGVNAPEYDRDVNDRDYDVALHLIFATAANQDVYQTHPRHLQFLAEYKSLWKRVRVFDTTLK